MYIPDELVEEVRMRSDIVDVISSYVRLNKKGNNYFGLCPFHNEKTGSFAVTPSKQMFYCFGCHVGGNAITFVQKYENMSFHEAVKVLADRAGVVIPDNMSEEDKKKAGRRALLLEINREAGKYYYYQLRSEAGKRGMEYFRGRGLSDETMQHFGLGYARSSANETYRYLKSKGYSDELLRASGLFVFREGAGMSDKFWNRVIFPIMDVNHRIIGFGGRVMGEGEPKYLNSPENEIFDKSRNLFGLNHAKTSKAKNIILCEGYMDVISLHQAGFTQAVASLGTAFTTGQASLIARYARDNQKGSDVVRYKEILLCYDSDGPGVDATLRALRILFEAGLTAKVINMRPYKDPDEFIKSLGVEEFQKRIDEAQNGLMFELEILERDYDIKDPTGKSKFIDDAASRLLRFENEIERDLYCSLISDKYDISKDNFMERVKKRAMQQMDYKPVEIPKSSRNGRTSVEEKQKKSQQELINMLSDMPQIYPFVKKYISADDFSDELYRKVVSILFEQIESGRPEQAKIISMFTEEEEQTLVASLLHGDMRSEVNYSEEGDRLNELLENILRFSIENDAARNDTNSMGNSIMALLEKRQKLEQLRDDKIDIGNLK